MQKKSSSKKAPTNGVPVPPVILRRSDLAIRYGCDFRTIQRYHNEGVIPPARYLPKRSSPFWYQHEILANENLKKKLQQRILKAQKIVAAQSQPNQFKFKF